MKREIIFRGLRTDGKGWVYGNLAYFFNDKQKAMIMPNCYFGTRDFGDEDEKGNPIISNDVALGGFISVLHEKVDQLTGLKDKNGTDIYERDILQTETGIASVIWSDAAFALLSPGSEATDWEHSSVYEKSEVIGNIHDNPELLK